MNPRLFDLSKSGGHGNGRSRYNTRTSNGNFNRGNDRRPAGNNGGDYNNRNRSNGYANGNDNNYNRDRNRSDGGGSRFSNNDSGNRFASNNSSAGGATSRFSNAVVDGSGAPPTSNSTRYANGGTRFSNIETTSSTAGNGGSRFSNSATAPSTEGSRFSNTDTYKSSSQNDFYQSGAKFGRPASTISSAIVPNNGYQAGYPPKSNGYEKKNSSQANGGGGSNYQQRYSNGYNTAQSSDAMYAYSSSSYPAK